MNVRNLIRESVNKALTENGKRNYVYLFRYMNPQDRKTIRYWKYRDEGNITVISFYSSLVGQGMIEFVTEFVEKYRGAFRLIPDDSLICIEMRIQSPNTLK